MRLWAIQLQVLPGPAATSTTYPQVIVEANDLNEAQERAKDRIRQDCADSMLRPHDIRVRATAEISLENIWIFNDTGFRNVE